MEKAKAKAKAKARVKASRKAKAKVRVDTTITHPTVKATADGSKEVGRRLAIAAARRVIDVDALVTSSRTVTAKQSCLPSRRRRGVKDSPLMRRRRINDCSASRRTRNRVKMELMKAM